MQRHPDPPESNAESNDDRVQTAAHDGEVARRFTADPFRVLEAPSTASRHELDAVVMRLLDALSRAEPGVTRYRTPLGERRRDAGTVNDAAHALRDAEHRIVHELWSRLPVRRQEIAPPPGCAPWNGGARALGWRRR